MQFSYHMFTSCMCEGLDLDFLEETGYPDQRRKIVVPFAENKKSMILFQFWNLADKNCVDAESGNIIILHPEWPGFILCSSDGSRTMILWNAVSSIVRL